MRACTPQQEVDSDLGTVRATDWDLSGRAPRAKTWVACSQHMLHLQDIQRRRRARDIDDVLLTAGTQLERHLHRIEPAGEMRHVVVAVIGQEAKSLRRQGQLLL